MPKADWKGRLTEARERAGLRKIQLARMLGVNPSTITDWEGTKVAMLDGESLVRVCHILHVTPEWLLHGNGHAADSAAVIEEFAWVYQHSNEEGRSFLRNTLTVAAETFVPQSEKRVIVTPVRKTKQ